MSKKTKFTKGEWSVFMPNEDCDYNDRDDEIVIGMSSFLVDPSHYDTIHKIVIEGFCWDCDSSEEEANAHLIKTAPKLYAILEDLSRLMVALDKQTHPNIELDAVKHDIDTLLAEARGE